MKNEAAFGFAILLFILSALAGSIFVRLVNAILSNPWLIALSIIAMVVIVLYRLRLKAISSRRK